MFFKKIVFICFLLLFGFVNLRASLVTVPDTDEPEPEYIIISFGSEYLKQGNYHKVIEICSQVMVDYPEYYEPYINRGIAYQRLGDYDKAEKDFKTALLKDCTSGDAENSLAWFMITAKDEKYRNKALSLIYAKDAVQSSRHPDPAFLDTLAAAYAANGDFDKAISFQIEAIEREIDEERKNGYINRLAMYRENKSYP